jgi:hypothetical protein
MKQISYIIALLLLHCASYAQQAQSLTRYSVSGTVSIPLFQELNVELLNQAPVEFKNPDDYNSGKIIHKFYRATIKSNVPWELSVAPANANFTSNTGKGAKFMPADILSLKNSTDNKFIKLSTVPVSIIQSSNNLLVNVYTIDLKVDPSWNYPGDIYSIDLLFSLSAP